MNSSWPFSRKVWDVGLGLGPGPGLAGGLPEILRVWEWACHWGQAKETSGNARVRRRTSRGAGELHDL
ncbi:hypothetical protein VUR80DRAFT_4816 [Thermomyces stellatus]